MSALTYVSAWRPIAARIRGLERAAEVHAAFLAGNSQSPYGADKYLHEHCLAIRDEVETFKNAFSSSLPKAAIASIDRFMADAGGQMRSPGISGEARVLLTRSIVVKISAFESELSFHLESPLERVRSASELAFMHLQRLIATDDDYQKKWTDAFAKREEECEALGALHLLWHGIWAFKAHASGGKTDLVYQEPLENIAAPIALGMVLTEWKKAGSDAAKAFADARHQASLYASGVLAGVELTTHRYLVAVTERQVHIPNDIIEGNVVYRHINIAVSPELPSIAAKRLAR